MLGGDSLSHKGSFWIALEVGRAVNCEMCVGNSDGSPILFGRACQVVEVVVRWRGQRVSVVGWQRTRKSSRGDGD